MSAETELVIKLHASSRRYEFADFSKTGESIESAATDSDGHDRAAARVKAGRATKENTGRLFLGIFGVDCLDRQMANSK